MAETVVNAYAVTSANAAATSPTPIAVVNDGSADRQIVVLGAGDGTGTIVDGTSANPVTVEQNDFTYTGTLSAANATVTTAALTGVSTASIQITGSWVGTITPQVSLDGPNYINLNATGLINTNTGAYSATIASAAIGIWQSDIAGFKYFQVKMTAYTSGTATVTLKLSNATGNVGLDNPLPPGSNTIGTVSINAQNVYPSASSSAVGQSLFLNNAVTTAVSVKASAGKLYDLNVYNTNASTAYIQIFNATSVTLGSTVPVLSYAVPAGGWLDKSLTIPFSFATGIMVAATTTYNGSTTATTGLAVNIGYI